MTVSDVRQIEEQLKTFLGSFGDLFHRSEARENLRVYVSGQLADLPRKSVEPIALAAGVDERSLQLFLSTRDWDQDELRNRMQRLVAADHADPRGIGIIDETAHPKKGNKTPGVKRQYCGNTGKIDNCIVTVHLAFTHWESEFTALLDSDLFLPEDWAQDHERCREAHIPADVRYRPKWKIALAQVARACANGVSLRWIVADEYYGSKPGFLAGIVDLGLSPVVEVPKSFRGWTLPPLALTDAARRTSKVEDLAKHSPYFDRGWTAYRVKESEKGPIVWEARATSFAFKHGNRIVTGATLIVARNLLHPEDVKYFVAVAPAQTPLADLLHVAFARPRIEESFLRAKDEMGLSHYEGRSYRGLVRHCHVTALSLLFALRQTQQLRGKKSGNHHLSSPSRHRRDRPAVA